MIFHGKEPIVKGYDFKRLYEEGFEPVGKPGLIACSSILVSRSDLERAVMAANPDSIEVVSGFALYWKTNSRRSEVSGPDSGILEVACRAGEANYLIVQPLRRII